VNCTPPHHLTASNGQQQAHDFWSLVSDDSTQLFDGADPSAAFSAVVSAAGQASASVGAASAASSSASGSKRSPWLPFFVRVAAVSEAGKGSLVRVHEYASARSVAGQDDVYQLRAVLSAVKDGEREHLVAHVLVAPDYVALHTQGQGQGQSSREPQWIVFNDFTVVPVSQYEAVHIDAAWKTPVLLVYSRYEPQASTLAMRVPDPIGDEVLLSMRNALSAAEAAAATRSFSPLLPAELPGAGTLVALDAEFVRVASEEAVSTPGGRRLVVKPVQFMLARVSVVRTWGDEAPFIDDYISTPEAHIQDYLTQFSGLKPGDLDSARSPHHVTTLKHAYLKLRYALQDHWRHPPSLYVMHSIGA